MLTNQLPLAQDTVEDLFTLVYVYVDDYLKAAARSGLLPYLANLTRREHMARS